MIRLIVQFLPRKVTIQRLFEGLRFPYVQQQILKVLKGGAHVTALQAPNGRSQVTAQYLIQGRRLLGPRIEFGIVLKPT